MKSRNHDDLRRMINDVKYAEYNSYYGKKIREEEAKRFYEAESRAYRDHRSTMRREYRSAGSTTVSVDGIKITFKTSLIVMSIFSTIALLAGATTIMESLILVVAGTVFFTIKSL